MTIRVSVAVALPQRQEVVAVELPDGSRLCDALAAARAQDRFPGTPIEALRVGIWGRACAPDTRLRDGDRVEIYRPLRADAKAQRRTRARVNPSTRPRNGP
jgi:putative ubiquitin-RnfH superfamily antitoxin RatB of RatAB toxin-antitoxin module